MSARGPAPRFAAAVVAMGCAAAVFVAAEPCADIAVLRRAGAGDALAPSRDGAACVITVEHRSGIGAGRIVASGHPLVLRFSRFPELESLGLASATGNLQCELQRGDTSPPAHRCRLDGIAVPGPERTLRGIEFRVPEAFALSPGEPLELRWVDYWR